MTEQDSKDKYIKCSRCKCKYINDDNHNKTDFGYNRLNERYNTCVTCRERHKQYNHTYNQNHKDESKEYRKEHKEEPKTATLKTNVKQHTVSDDKILGKKMAKEAEHMHWSDMNPKIKTLWIKSALERKYGKTNNDEELVKLKLKHPNNTLSNMGKRYAWQHVSDNVKLKSLQNVKDRLGQ